MHRRLRGGMEGTSGVMVEIGTHSIAFVQALARTG
jgi:hypothetical protein